MNNKTLKAAFAGLVLSVSSFANAGLIVDQSFDSSNIISGANFSQDNSSLFDDFMISEVSNIDTISMWGGYWTSGAQPSSFDFRIQIRTDVTAASVIYDTAIIASVVSDTGFNHNNSRLSDILKFDFDVTGLTLNSGNYFIGISSQNHPGTSFYWQRDNTLGNGSASFDGTIGNTSGNLTLAINESTAQVSEPTQVPEPSTLAIFALGVIGLASRRFKK